MMYLLDLTGLENMMLEAKPQVKSLNAPNELRSGKRLFKKPFKQYSLKINILNEIICCRPKQVINHTLSRSFQRKGT